MKDLIFELTTVFGPSGDEEVVKQWIEDKVKPYADETSSDALGNLIVYKKGESSAKKIMFAAHMDTIGIIVTYVDEKGYGRFVALGSTKGKAIANQKVIFKNGVIGVIAHEEKDADAMSPMEKFYIDFGTSSREETLELISIGDTAVYYAPAAELANDVITTPYVDNRVACAILIDTLMTQKYYKYDTYFVFSTQEEVGMRGAQVAAFAIKPDLGLAVDGTWTNDVIEPDKHLDVKLGGGAAIKVMDYYVLCSPAVRKMLIETAKENEIPYQIEVISGGGSDTATIQMAGAGVPACCISYPMRYIHTMSEVCSLIDLENCKKLVCKVIENGGKL